MKVALVHDWLTGMRGGERCLEAFLELYPEADIYTLFHVPGSTSSTIDARVKKVSLLNSFPGARRYYRALLPLYPFAIRSFCFEGYDLVISLSHAAAKNISVPAATTHLCYCFTPMRYIWDQAHAYLGAFTPVAWPLIAMLRKWDARPSGGRRVDAFVAISNFIAARIRCFYGRRASVIYPPVRSDWISPLPLPPQERAFLYAGALVPYKKVDLVVRAFNELELPLWIVGSGPQEASLRRLAKANIKFFGRVSDAQLARFYAHCRALLFPGKEDFGLVPIECLAAGRPVIGIYAGALRETLHGLKPWTEHEAQSVEKSGSYSSLAGTKATGVFIPHRRGDEVSALIDSIKFFIQHEDAFSTEACVAQAERFSVRRFKDEWNALLHKHGIAHLAAPHEVVVAKSA